jgi:hypothetical protein
MAPLNCRIGRKFLVSQVKFLNRTLDPHIESNTQHFTGGSRILGGKTGPLDLLIDHVRIFFGDL